MKNNFSKLVLSFFLALVSMGVFAQQRTLTGKVTDAAGLPLVGATVAVTGTTQGTLTDADGKYSISIPANTAILQFSFVGYVSQKVTVSTQTSIDVVMTEDSKSLDEVVVIGYGTVKRSDLTGSVASVTPAQIANRAFSNVGQILQGQASGVDVTDGEGGRPGSSPSIRIRGTTSINSGSPLVVIDGMIGDMNMVSPNEIERMEVLKDASSTAIYGARGANGVIMITTKKGKVGTPVINYTGYYGVATPGKNMEMLNGSQYTDLILDIQGKNNYDPATGHWIPTSAVGILGDGINTTFYDPDIIDYARQDNGDWYHALFHNASVTEHNFSVSGGSDKVTYRLNVGYNDQESTRGTYRMRRYTVKLVNDYKLFNDVLKFGNNIMVRFAKNTGIDGDMNGMMMNPANRPVQDLEGKYIAPGYAQNPHNYSFGTNPYHFNNQGNPMSAIAGTTSLYNEIKLAAQFYGELSIIKNILMFRSQIQYESSYDHNLSYLSESYFQNTQTAPYLNESYSMANYPKYENYLSYNQEFGKHSVSAVAGISYERNQWGRNLGVSASGFQNFNVLLPTFGSSSSINAAGCFQQASLSYFGRINYTLSNKYILTANLRADASYRFAPGNRWGYFPSFAAAWKVNEEEFLKNITWISALKLRANWGIVGNDAINAYQYMANLYTGGKNNVRYPFGTSVTPYDPTGVYGTGYTNDLSQLQKGVTVNSLPTSDIKWEETRTAGIGLDASFLKDKINFTLDYYDKYTSDILIAVPLAYSTGIYTSTTSNAASVSNRGIEMQLTWRDQIGDLNYTISGNASYNKNNVESLGAGEPIQGGSHQGVGGYTTRTEVGYPIGYFYGRKTDGILATTADADAYNARFGTSLKAGDMKYKDLNEDGKIDDNDRCYLGDGMPKWILGANLDLSYKGFDFRTSLYGSVGSKIYFVEKSWYENMNNARNHTIAVLNRWKYEGDTEATLPRADIDAPAQNYIGSDRWIEDGSYLRMKSITLGYTVPSQILKSFTNNTVSNLRLYVTSENLFTVTKYSGFNPEVRSSGVTTRNLETTLTTPVPQTFVFGVQLTF
jgi:TonB-linked SusC/RagA family outer membrane protein